jgi:hypothetical protein
MLNFLFPSFMPPGGWAYDVTDAMGFNKIPSQRYLKF